MLERLKQIGGLMAIPYDRLFTLLYVMATLVFLYAYLA